MAYSLVTNVAAGSTNTLGITTGAVDTTGADLLVAVASCYNAISGQVVVTDSKGNTWIGLTTQLSGDGEDYRMWYSYNPVVGSGHTFTSDNGGAGYSSIAVAAFSGSQTSPDPKDQQAGTGTSGVTSLQPGSITPSADGELVVTGIGFNATNTMSINSSFNITDQINASSGLRQGVALAYKIQTTAAAVNPTWSWGSSSGAGTSQTSFKATGGSPPTPVFGNTIQFLQLLGIGA